MLCLLLVVVVKDKVQPVQLLSATDDFIKNVLSVYTHSMMTIYLSQSAQVAKSTFFMKSPVLGWANAIKMPDQHNN